MSQDRRTPQDFWRNVTYPAEGRAKPVGQASEGEVDKFLLEKENGELEILEPSELNKLNFENDFFRQKAVIPYEMLFTRKNGEAYETIEGDEVPIKIVTSHMGDSVIGIEFEGSVSKMELEEAGIIAPRDSDD